MAACGIDLILNAEVSGTTSTNIGSARIITGSNTQASFRAMMGTSTSATASLEVKRFTGATSILKLNTAGIGLQDVSGSQRTIGNSAVTGSWATGKVDSYSLDFDGVDEYVIIPSGSDLPIGKTGGDFTVAAWCLQETDEAWLHVVNRSGWTGGWGLGKELVGKMEFRVAGYNQATASFTELDTWTHFVGIYNSALAQVTIYKNGVLGSTSATPAGAASLTDLRIGAVSGTAPANLYEWKGKIDEVGIWNVALDSSAIDDLYNDNTGSLCNTISSSNLVAYYNMEDGPGASILTDRTGNGYNGTLTNMETGSLLLVDDWYDFYASGSAADVSTLVKGIRVILQ